jgi:hypothetical protein
MVFREAAVADTNEETPLPRRPIIDSASKYSSRPER